MILIFLRISDNKSYWSNKIIIIFKVSKKGNIINMIAKVYFSQKELILS